MFLEKNSEIEANFGSSRQLTWARIFFEMASLSSFSELNWSDWNEDELTSMKTSCNICISKEHNLIKTDILML